MIVLQCKYCGQITHLSQLGLIAQDAVVQWVCIRCAPHATTVPAFLAAQCIVCGCEFEGEDCPCCGGALS